jgi:hypothetical protein
MFSRIENMQYVCHFIYAARGGKVVGIEIVADFQISTHFDSRSNTNPVVIWPFTLEFGDFKPAVFMLSSALCVRLWILS